MYFLAVLEARSPRPRSQHGQFLVRALLLACNHLLTVSSHDRQRENKLSGVSPSKDTNPMRSGLHLMTVSNPKNLSKTPFPKS